jgi:hypothetical protein
LTSEDNRHEDAIKCWKAVVQLLPIAKDSDKPHPTQKMTTNLEPSADESDSNGVQMVDITNAGFGRDSSSEESVEDEQTVLQEESDEQELGMLQKCTLEVQMT